MFQLSGLQTRRSLGDHKFPVLEGSVEHVAVTLIQVAQVEFILICDFALEIWPQLATGIARVLRFAGHSWLGLNESMS